jgi:hypothetical protein
MGCSGEKVKTKFEGVQWEECMKVVLLVCRVSDSVGPKLRP